VDRGAGAAGPADDQRSAADTPVLDAFQEKLVRVERHEIVGQHAPVPGGSIYVTRMVAFAVRQCRSDRDRGTLRDRQIDR
jgi:hypothetical protein